MSTLQGNDFEDGNVLGGPFAEIFVHDLTSATGQCRFCGLDGPMAAVHVYTRAPGVVVRCPGCQEVLLRLVSTPRGLELDASGLSHLSWRL
ncbi:DUF6510 family protein [Rhodococcus wratislaviensis]|uniref:DUF6510 family protein n=1 Tax=Rhodococcus wratislaviensis TaxID=44752 RepID=UPI00351961EB